MRRFDVHRTRYTQLPGFNTVEKTTVHDRQTDRYGRGIGSTRKQADQRAWDDLSGKNSQGSSSGSGGSGK